VVDLIAAGKLPEALPLAQLAVALVTPDHPLYAPALDNLARVLIGLNRLGQAEALFRSALAKAEQKLGPDHPGVAKALIDLAHTLKNGAVIPLMRRALAIVEKSYGPTHPKLADTYYDLATMYADAGDWGEAARLHRSAKLIRVVDQGKENLSLRI
jgi:tetratricopeptide (TPR) repeat protein